VEIDRNCLQPSVVSVLGIIHVALRKGGFVRVVYFNSIYSAIGNLKKL
jgi:hypothetical protein